MKKKEYLEKKVVESMMQYGGSHKKTVKLSQALDIIIVSEQKKRIGKNKLRC